MIDVIGTTMADFVCANDAHFLANQHNKEIAMLKADAGLMEKEIKND